MKYWVQFLKEKRTAILLYIVTVLLFLVTGSLYHVENLRKLLYATLLTFALWCVVGVIQGLKYVNRCRKLEAAERQLEQYGEPALGEILSRKEIFSESGNGVIGVEQRLEHLLLLAHECWERARLNEEEKAADRRDYYLMWTHQIKTPISALKLLLEKNQNCKDGFLMREELFKIEQYAEMVLTFQRLDSMASDLVLQEYELVPLLKQAVRKYSVLFINKGLNVEMPEGNVRILTDQKWFSFCLEQMLSNSIKYTETGGVRLEVEDGEKSVRLILTDTGMGIRPEDLPRIFEKGFTGYNGRLDKKSTGIGLYLCKQVFDRLGIVVAAESEVGIGTRMILTIHKPDRLKQ